MIHLYNNGKNRASKSFWMWEGNEGRMGRAMRRLGEVRIGEGVGERRSVMNVI